ncbi:hypothetical protein MC885_009506 [Smutsia gigantea]|nr:hypothetical protein MC885_009506 [Smutsia gigantea]
MAPAPTAQMGTLRPEGALPEHAAFAFPILMFVHLSCSGVPRSVPQVSKVKSVCLDAWEEAQVQFMASHRNNTARDTYESKALSYYWPTFSDCQ